MTIDTIIKRSRKGFPTPNRDYKVFVRCITYNHSRFITDTLNGFAIQKTDFPFLCFVIDDASTDGEQTVLLSYVEAECEIKNAEFFDNDLSFIIIAPHRLNKNCTYAFYLLKRNLYHQRQEKESLYNTWRNVCTYEAICEGDDYWTEESKLQMQVDFLDNETEYGMCYTQCQYFYDTKKYFKTKSWGGPYESFQQFMKGNTVPTLTVLFRIRTDKKYLEEINPASKSWKMGDYPRWIWYSHESKIKFIPCTTGVYRVLSSSASHSSDINEQIKFYESSLNIRHFFEEYFNIPAGTYVKHNSMEKRKLYLFAINHKCLNFLITLFRNPEFLLNIKVLGYTRYFFLKKRTSEEV